MKEYYHKIGNADQWIYDMEEDIKRVLKKYNVKVMSTETDGDGDNGMFAYWKEDEYHRCEWNGITVGTLDNLDDIV